MRLLLTWMDYRCRPKDGSKNAETFGLVAVTICTQTNSRILNDGFKSFPSGHASGEFTRFSSSFSPLLTRYSRFRWPRLPLILSGWEAPYPRHPRRGLEDPIGSHSSSRRISCLRQPHHGCPTSPIRHHKRRCPGFLRRLGLVPPILPSSIRDMEKRPRIPYALMGHRLGPA